MYDFSIKFSRKVSVKTMASCRLGNTVLPVIGMLTEANFMKLTYKLSSLDNNTQLTAAKAREADDVVKRILVSQMQLQFGNHTLALLARKGISCHQSQMPNSYVPLDTTLKISRRYLVCLLSQERSMTAHCKPHGLHRDPQCLLRQNSILSGVCMSAFHQDDTYLPIFSQ